VDAENTCRRCLSLVGLARVVVLEVEDRPGVPLRVHVELEETPQGCGGCGVLAHVKERRRVELVDLPAFGRPARLVWVKRRFRCPEPTCSVGSWTEEAPEIAHWHTVNDAVLAYGEALVDDDPHRFGTVAALGLDEVLFVRLGRFHAQHFSTSIVDVQRGQLLDVVPGRSGVRPSEWLESQGQAWRDEVRYATLDLSGAYRSVFDRMVPRATQVADPFHVVKLANTKLDECRRRVQNDTLGHRGRKSDPLWRSRPLLTKADKRLDEGGREKLFGLLRAGDPRGDVKTTWHAKEAVRELYAHTDADLALAYVERLAADMADRDQPIEVRSLGRTLKRWRHQIAAWHTAQVTNGPTEAANNLIKRVKRAAFGFTSFRNYRIRALLYAGKPNWSLLSTITPR